jgi:hypothetical protein
MTNNGEAAPLTRVYAGTRVPFSAGGAVVMWSDGGKAHVLRKRLDLANQSFKRAVIGRLDQDEWKMTAADIVARLGPIE